MHNHPLLSSPLCAHRFYTPRGANDYRNSSSEGDYGTPRDNKDTHDSEYLVPNPHNYWNEVASSKHQEDFEEDEHAFGMMEGVSEKDVSDTLGGHCACQGEIFLATHHYNTTITTPTIPKLAHCFI